MLDMNKKSTQTIFLGLLFLSFFIPTASSGISRGEEAQSRRIHEARVIAVNDGDTVTIKMASKEHRCRLIGIDAPEMEQEPWGERAREHLRKIVKDAQWRVFVETDIVKRDKYERLLVYLWTEDGMMINERMILEGNAVLFTVQPNSKYADRFSKAQRVAREKRLGIWASDGLKERPLDYRKKHPRE
jgi:micrococcal nuclease